METPARIEWPWPSSDSYALAHRCLYCKAEPLAECVWAEKRRRTRYSLPLARFHAARRHSGAAHYSRDVRKAPWREDRVLGVRYDTLGDLWDGRETMGGWG